MKHKKAIIISTVMIFVVAAIVALGWLFRARYFIVNDLNGKGDDSAESELYTFVNDALENTYKGKWMFTFNETQIKDLLAKNPYVEVIEIKKSVPDKVEVTFAEREERFFIVDSDAGYVTDVNYNLLRKVENVAEADDSNLVKVIASGVGLDFSSIVVGKKIAFEEENLFGSMTEIFDSFTDKLNFIESVVIDGEKDLVEYKTQTGVIIDVSLSVAGKDKPSADERKATKERICAKVPEIENIYESLDERCKRSGYIKVYEMDDKTVKVNYEPKTEIADEEEENA